MPAGLLTSFITFPQTAVYYFLNVFRSHRRDHVPCDDPGIVELADMLCANGILALFLFQQFEVFPVNLPVLVANELLTCLRFLPYIHCPWNFFVLP